jgi:hypothetical protein
VGHLGLNPDGPSPREPAVMQYHPTFRIDACQPLTVLFCRFANPSTNKKTVTTDNDSGEGNSLSAHSGAGRLVNVHGTTPGNGLVVVPAMGDTSWVARASSLHGSLCRSVQAILPVGQVSCVERR